MKNLCLILCKLVIIIVFVNEIVTKIMKNHMPVHLKKMAKDMAFLRLFEDAISAPVASLCERKYLLPYSGDSLLPTTYIILK